MQADANFPAIENLLPHRGSLLLLDRVLSADDDGICVEAHVPNSGWQVDADGSMPAWIGIELMAQAVAAHVGLQARKEGRPPKQGVLLGTRAYRTVRASFAANCILHIQAKLVFRDESGLGAYDCAISSVQEEWASATLKVYEPKDFAAFIRENKQ